jgi:outer membrane protein assembly factor BamB
MRFCLICNAVMHLFFAFAWLCSCATTAPAAKDAPVATPPLDTSPAQVVGPIQVPTHTPTALALMRFSGKIHAQPSLLSAQDIVAAALDGSVALITPQGQTRWQVNLSSPVYGGPAIGNGLIYAASYKGDVIALDSHGKVRWRTEVQGPIVSPVVASGDGTLFVAGHGLSAIHPSGQVLWRFVTAAPLHGAAALHPKQLVVVGTVDGLVLAIHRRGTLAWQYDTRASIVSPVLVQKDGSVFVGTEGRGLIALSADGQLLWNFPTPCPIRSRPSFASKLIVFGCGDGQLYAVNNHGQLAWTFQAEGSIDVQPQVDRSGRIVFGSAGGFVYALDSDGKLLWEVFIGQAVVASPRLTSDGTILVGANDGVLYALRHLAL